METRCEQETDHASEKPQNICKLVQSDRNGEEQEFPQKQFFDGRRE